MQAASLFVLLLSVGISHYKARRAQSCVSSRNRVCGAEQGMPVAEECHEDSPDLQTTFGSRAEPETAMYDKMDNEWIDRVNEGAMEEKGGSAKRCGRRAVSGSARRPSKVGRAKIADVSGCLEPASDLQAPNTLADGSKRSRRRSAAPGVAAADALDTLNGPSVETAQQDAECTTIPTARTHGRKGSRALRVNKKRKRASVHKTGEKTSAEERSQAQTETCERDIDVSYAMPSLPGPPKEEELVGGAVKGAQEQGDDYCELRASFM